MAILIKLLTLGATLLLPQHTQALPVQPSTCDFNTPTPSGWTPSMEAQWCAMITTEKSALQATEDPQILLPLLTALFQQAQILAPPTCVLSSAEEIMNHSTARAALTQMKSNYPTTGSMDLTEPQIQTIYSPALRAARTATGAPEALLVKMIWTESKGHPLISNGGLTQIDNVAFGQQMDKNPDLKNRYVPADNIMAAAMRLRQGKDQAGCDWEEAYYQHYQDPGVKGRSG